MRSLAEAYLEAKETDAARREAERALAIDARHEGARRVLGHLPPP